jgi:hypothetical protein
MKGKTDGQVPTHNASGDASIWEEPIRRSTRRFLFLAGAELVPSSVLGQGLIGLGYTAARTVGKIAGARIGLRGQDVPDVVRRQIGFCLVSSSSLAVGLTIQIRSAFPAYAATVTGIVLAAVVIFEVVGPLLTRRALLVTGEARTMPSPLSEVAE